MTASGNTFVPMDGAKGSSLFDFSNERTLSLANSRVHTLASNGDTIYAATYDAAVRVVDRGKVSSLTGSPTEVLSLASKFNRLWFTHYVESAGVVKRSLSVSPARDPLAPKVISGVSEPLRLIVVGDRLLVSTEKKTFGLSPDRDPEPAYPFRVMDAVKCGADTWVAIADVGVKRGGTGDVVAPEATDAFDIACRPGGIWILAFSSGLWSVDI